MYTFSLSNSDQVKFIQKFVLVPLVLSLLLLIACSGSKETAKNTPKLPKNSVVLITDEKQVDANVGKLVRLEGVVANSKQPTLLGVDISCDSLDLRGQKAWAYGLLDKIVAKEPETEPISATRGAGTYYQLIDPSTKMFANVRKL